MINQAVLREIKKRTNKISISWMGGLILGMELFFIKSHNNHLDIYTNIRFLFNALVPVGAFLLFYSAFRGIKSYYSGNSALISLKKKLNEKTEKSRYVWGFLDISVSFFWELIDIPMAMFWGIVTGLYGLIIITNIF